MFVYEDISGARACNSSHCCRVRLLMQSARARVVLDRAGLSINSAFVVHVYVSNGILCKSSCYMPNQKAYVIGVPLSVCSFGLIFDYGRVQVII